LSYGVIQFGKAVLLLTAFLSIAGCTVYSSRTQADSPGHPIIEKRTSPNGNFHVVRDHVEGEASCAHLLYMQYPGWLRQVLTLKVPYATGIALGDSDLRERAMADLYKKHVFQGDTQQFNNIIEEWSISNYLGIYAKVKLKVTAEVIEFDRET
jgi:hypothetical protein